jgi:hypothetical protein
MAERDKVIKTGQLTIPRIFFLVLVGGLIVAMVSLGGKALIIGYWVLTLAICGLLYLIAIDYRVKMDKVELTAQPAQATAAAESVSTVASSVKVSASQPRPKRRTARPAKRRR